MQVNIFKSAMKSGLILGGIFSLNFVASLGMGMIWTLLTWLIIAVIIYMTYKLTVNFRDKECGGYISYSRSLLFILMSFFYASLISSLVKFIYFQFINPDYLENLLNQSMLLMDQLKLPVDENAESAMRSLLKPASFSLQYIWVNMLFGSILGLIMSAFTKKEKNIFEQ